MADRQIRCVITGLGVISAIGGNVEECWDSILASRSGIAHTNTLDTADCYADYAAEVKGLEESDPTLDWAAALCLRATGEALSDAGLSDFGNSERASVIMGSCVGGGRSLESYYRGGKQPADVLKMPISPIANHVAAAVGAGGVVTNVANACAAGTISIAYASDLIRAGKADVVIAGGTDAFSSVPYSGFLSLHALDENSCSPFNHSHGITLGEGENAKTASVEYSIEKATPTAENFSFTAPTDLIYNGKAKTAAIAPNIGITGMGDVSVKYDRDGREVQNPTNAGTYTVKIAVIEGTNYATRILWLFFKMPKICAAPIKPLPCRASGLTA